MTDPKTYLAPAEEKMELAVAYLDESLSHIRAGRANPKLLDGIRVEYYGSAVPISNVANISTPDARTIAITPWEKPMFKEIERAIINSELGVMPENNGEIIRISIPPLTEERRKQLVKQCKAEAETAKVSVRNARRDAIEGLKKAVKKGMPEDVEKDAEGDAQKVLDKYMKKIDDIFAAKEKEILTV
jgi:ribosome recycling factor